MRTLPATLTATAAVGGAALIGGAYGPQRPRAALWYALLRKPSFTPPGALIAAVWTALEGLLIFSGARLLRRPASPRRNAALALWGLTLVGLAGFPAVFFGQRRLGLSVVTAGGMCSAAAASAMLAAGPDRKSAEGLLPTVLWTGFATVLAGEIWAMNRRRRLPSGRAVARIAVRAREDVPALEPARDVMAALGRGTARALRALV